jgi:hypothetical protein
MKFTVIWGSGAAAALPLALPFFAPVAGLSAAAGFLVFDAAAGSFLAFLSTALDRLSLSFFFFSGCFLSVAVLLSN